MTEPGTDRHERPRDRVTERLDALEAQAREQLALIEALRTDLDKSGDDVAEVRAELKAVAAGQGALAAQVGLMQVAISRLDGKIGDEKSGLVAQVQALAGRVPSGAAVATLGAGVGMGGLGSMVSIFYALAQALGWIGAQ